jgi:uncharacterized damage-inducible protein DinB
MGENRPDRALVELLRGRGAHTDSVACVSGLTALLAGQALPPSPHTIWGIVAHMNYWMHYEVQRIGGTPPAYPVHAELSWPKIPDPPQEEPWAETVQIFVSLIGELETFARTPSILERVVPPVHATEQDVDRTVHGILLQMVAHNSYHLGQVALIRRALGAWPPPGGSDTW